MDGSFNLSVARPKYTLVCSYVGYKKCEVEIGNKDTEIVIPLKSDDVVLEGVTVIANNPGRTRAWCPWHRTRCDECGKRNEC